MEYREEREFAVRKALVDDGYTEARGDGEIEVVGTLEEVARVAAQVLDDQYRTEMERRAIRDRDEWTRRMDTQAAAYAEEIRRLSAELCGPRPAGVSGEGEPDWGEGRRM